MAVGLTLPEDKDPLVSAVEDMKEAARPTRNAHKIKWLKILRYMAGDRNFADANYELGTISTIISQEPMNVLKFEGLLPYYQLELGRMLQIDLRPLVKRRGQGLDGLQKAGIGQIVLNAKMSDQQADVFKDNLITLFLQLGHCAIGAFKGPTGPGLEIIAPWEIMHSPVVSAYVNNVEAILRVRFVTESWLKENIDEKILAEAKEGDYEWQKLPVGQTPNDSSVLKSKNLEAKPLFGTLAKALGSKKTQRYQKWTEFAEIWVRSPQNRLRDYVSLAGKNIIERQRDLIEQDIPMPVNECRYLSVGAAYARGFVEQQIELNAEVEEMLDRLGQNVKDFDQYGVTVIPTGMGMSKAGVQEAKQSGYMFYSTDLYNPDAKPFSLMPTNSGTTAPTRTAQMFLGLMNTQAQQSDVLKGDAPGRVDSAKALNLLFETANMPLGGPTSSLAAGIAASYEALLWLIKQEWGERQTVELTLNDDALVGIKYDQRTGKVEVERDAIPDPDEVMISIAAKMPRSPAQVRADLDDQLEKQQITPVEYAIKVREAGLDLPVGYEIEWQNFRKSKIENVIMYGDGLTPGNMDSEDNPQIAFSPEWDVHEIHLSVHHAFMSRPEFNLASKEVKEVFENHYLETKAELGTLQPTADEVGQQADQMPGLQQQLQTMQGQGA